MLSHAFTPSARERIFKGGNWRAVPILRTMAEAFFSLESQRRMREGGEEPPLWAFMCDDDSFTFTPQLLSTLARYDPDEPHYLGYAFIASPHLEGIKPGVRQPLFANGGAGIAVSRAAMRLVLPHIEKCAAEGGVGERDGRGRGMKVKLEVYIVGRDSGGLGRDGSRD